MMTIAYSAFGAPSEKQRMPQQQGNNDEALLRNIAYLAACSKYSTEIAAIQKFFPGWLPNPPSYK